MHLEYLVWASCAVDYNEWQEQRAAALVMLHAILTLSAFIELNYKGMDAR